MHRGMVGRSGTETLTGGFRALSNVNGGSAGGEASSGDPVKKKRGRPRKHDPDGTVSLTPSATADDSSLASGTPAPEKRRKGRPPGSGWKQRLASLGITKTEGGESLSSDDETLTQSGKPVSAPSDSIAPIMPFVSEKELQIISPCLEMVPIEPLPLDPLLEDPILARLAPEDAKLVSDFAKRHPSALLPDFPSLSYKVLGLESLAKFLNLLRLHPALEISTTMRDQVLDQVEMLRCFGFCGAWLESVAERLSGPLAAFDLVNLDRLDQEIWHKNQQVEILTQKVDHLSSQLTSIRASLDMAKSDLSSLHERKTHLLEMKTALSVPFDI